MNLFDLFAERAARQPDHPLIITPSEEVSFGAFLSGVEVLAAKLRSFGVAPDQCIGLHYPNSAAYIQLTYAIWRCGACVVPIPVELSAPEKEQIVHQICIDAVLSQAAILSDLDGVTTNTRESVSDEAVFVGVKRYREHPPEFVHINAAFIRFSSGTTGSAKGVVLSHRTIWERIEGVNEILRLGPQDRVVWLLSMAYHFAVTIVAYLTYGVTIILCPNSFGSTIIRTAVNRQATIIYAAPTHYALMAHDRGELMLPSVRLAIVTTAALSTETAAAFYRRFQMPLNETYGIIEAGLPCINFGHPLEKQGSVGQVLPAYEIRLGEGAQQTSLGEIYLRGKGFLDAYYEPWRARSEIFSQKQGWFDTGDIGELDAAGYLYIRGRSKEVISVGGMKVFPREVEAVLELHPAVQEACVFRYPDRRLGEVPHARLVAKRPVPVNSSTDWDRELREFCGKHLASHKIPEAFTFVDHLTRTASGKLIRNYSKLARAEMAQV